MVHVRIASPRSRSTMLGQLGLSVTATVAASLILAGARHEIEAFRTVPAQQTTNGGKFQARVEALRSEAADAEPLGVVVPRVPLLAADPMLRALPASFAVANSADEQVRPVPDATRPTRRAARAEIRHRSVADTVRDVAPPRRIDTVAAAVEEPGTVESDGIVGGVWSATKGVVRETLDVGGAAITRLNPLNLVR